MLWCGRRHEIIIINCPRERTRSSTLIRYNGRLAAPDADADADADAGTTVFVVFLFFFRSKNDAASPERCSRQVGLESSTNQSIQSIRERESLVFWRVFDGFVFFIVYSRRPLRLSARASRPGGGGGWAETKRERKTVDDETAAGKIALFVARQSKAIFFSSFGGRDKA